MKLKDRLTVVEVFETYRNGNVTDARKHIKRMSKAQFIDFLEHARGYGVMPHKLRHLVDTEK